MDAAVLDVQERRMFLFRMGCVVNCWLCAPTVSYYELLWGLLWDVLNGRCYDVWAMCINVV